MEAVALAALAWMFAWIGMNWAALPDLVPRHFSGGVPDAWGAKGSVWVLPSIAAVLYGVLTVLAFFPRIYATPFTVDRNDPAVRHLLTQMMIATKMVLGLVFAYVNWARLRVALGEAEGIGRLMLPLVMVAFLAPAAVYALRLRRHQ